MKREVADSRADALILCSLCRRRSRTCTADDPPVLLKVNNVLVRQTRQISIQVSLDAGRGLVIVLASLPDILFTKIHNAHGAATLDVMAADRTLATFEAEGHQNGPFACGASVSVSMSSPVSELRSSEEEAMDRDSEAGAGRQGFARAFNDALFFSARVLR